MSGLLADDRATLVWLGIASAAMFVGSLILVPVSLVRMRPDYFLSRHESGETEAGRPAAHRWIRRILKNVLGLVLILVGVALLVLPGQGVLMIVLGTALLSFPGKRALVLRLVRLRGVRRTIDAVRARYGRPPLVLPGVTARGEQGP